MNTLLIRTIILFILIPVRILCEGTALPIPKSPTVEIEIEHAQTPQELLWGLMRRPSLPTHSGMLFSYPDEKLRSFWMFNTLIDLSVAFLDSNHVIREIHEMKAYPQLIDAQHAIQKIQELSKFPPNDPILAFFSRHKINSRYPAHYALEMNKRWFTGQNIHVGDVVIWNENDSKAYVIKTVNLAQYIHTQPQSLILELSEFPIAVWLPDEEQDHQVVFLDVKGNPVQTNLLKGGKTFPLPLKPVVHTNQPVKYLMVLPEKISVNK